MNLSLNIKNEQILERLLWVLEHFKNDGVEVVDFKNVSSVKSTTYTQLENLQQTSGKSELLEHIMLGMPKDYQYKPSSLSDKEIWYEEVKNKYE